MRSLIIIWVLALVVGVGGYSYINGAGSKPVSAQAVSDKYDGDCPTPPAFATAGRCADKCPAPTDQGTYYLQGFNKDTGAAVCGFTYYHACPYADAQPADSPVCQKLTAEAQVQPAPADQQFTGK